MENRLKAIITALAEAKVKFVIAGGVAAVLHGVERVTMDLDLAIEMNRDNLEGFLRVINRFGLTPRVPLPPQILLNPEKVRQIVEEKNAVVFTFLDVNFPIWHVDVFLREDHSYSELSKDAVTVTIEGNGIKVASIRKLIDLKRRITPRRPKDVMDIEELSRLIGEEK
jgi:predicted nucleotidyltransferase